MKNERVLVAWLATAPFSAAAKVIDAHLTESDRVRAREISHAQSRLNSQVARLALRKLLRELLDEDLARELRLDRAEDHHGPRPEQLPLHDRARVGAQKAHFFAGDR